MMRGAVMVLLVTGAILPVTVHAQVERPRLTGADSTALERAARQQRSTPASSPSLPNTGIMVTRQPFPCE